MLYSFGIPQILLDTFCQDLLLAVLKHPKMGVDNFGAYLMFANPQICIADGSLIEDIYIYIYICIYIYIYIREDPLILPPATKTGLISFILSSVFWWLFRWLESLLPGRAKVAETGFPTLWANLDPGITSNRWFLRFFYMTGIGKSWMVTNTTVYHSNAGMRFQVTGKG